MDSLHFSLFGKFEVRAGQQQVVDLGSQKMRELLAYLLIYRDRPHFREELATLLWEDSSSSQARSYLRQKLYHVQSLLKQSAGSEKGYSPTRIRLGAGGQQGGVLAGRREF
jgi:DNA-binding SARP family transcriptional activator